VPGYEEVSSGAPIQRMSEAGCLDRAKRPGRRAFHGGAFVGSCVFVPGKSLCFLTGVSFVSFVVRVPWWLLARKVIDG